MRKEYLFAFLSSLFIALIFFYPLFKRNIPFPGDLLMGHYEPYKSYSYLGYAPGGVPHKAQGTDAIRELYPWKQFTIEEFKKGSIAFWNPYNFSGNPHFANFQSGPFYIGNILFFLLPFHLGWAVYMIAEHIFAGFFTYLFLRKTSLGKVSSTFGGMCFAFSGFLMSWGQYGVMGHSLLWLPLVLFLILSYLEKKKLVSLFLITAALTSSILAGYIQIATYVYIFTTALLLYKFFSEKERQKVRNAYFQLAVAVFSPILLTLPQFLPTMEFVAQSLRSPYTFNQLSERLIPIVNLITIIVPDFFGNPVSRNYWLSGTYIERSSYIGIISIVFGVFALFGKNPYKKFFFGAAITIYLSALDILPVKAFHALSIPFLSTGVPSRILSIYCFSASVLAGIGFDTWQQDKQKKKYMLVIAVVAALLFLAWMAVFLFPSEHFAVTKRNLILPSAILLGGTVLIWLKDRLPRKVILLGLVFLVGFDLFYYFHKFTPFAPQAFIYPKTPVVEKLKEIQGIDRYWGYGNGNIAANFQLYEKNYSTEGYDALYIKRYGELIAASKEGKIPKDIPHTTATIAPGYGEDDLRDNTYRQRALNFFGVKYVLNRTDKSGADYKTFPPKTYTMIWEESPWQIYENKEVFPRTFLASGYIVETQKEKIIEKMYDSRFDLRTTAILEENPTELVDFTNDPNARVAIQKYNPNEITLTTNANTNMILVLSDNFYPGWEVSIDGKHDKIYRANYTFRAVTVEKGEHEIVFSYYPSSFDVGLKISIATGTIVLVLLAGTYFKRRYV